MVQKIHGFSQDYAGQTGKGEIVQLWLTHEVDQTGVIATRTELVADGLLSSATLAADNSFTINGVTYTTNALYDQAFTAQRNLDNLVARFSEIAVPVNVDVSEGLVQSGTNNTTPRLGSVTQLIAGSEVFGSELIETSGLVWEVDLYFESKGMFNDAPGTPTFVKGETSLGAAADRFGSSVNAIHDWLGTDAGAAGKTPVVMYVTGPLSAGGDAENMVDADTTEAFADGTNIVTGTAGAFAGAVGDECYLVTNNGAAAATSQTVLVEVKVAPNLQS